LSDTALHTVLASYLTAAETEGRSLTDAEARLIESLATLPTPSTVDTEAREAIAALRESVVTPLSPAPALPAYASLLPSREDMHAMVQAIRSKTPVSVTAAAAAYDTSMPLGAPLTDVSRLVDVLRGLGAAEAPMARNVEVPRIASGDAAVWTSGTKAEIVTELATIAATVCAAWTEVTTTGFMDIRNLDSLLGRLLARRVVLKENLAVADSLETQGTAATAGVDAVGTVIGALVEASKSGQQPSILMLSDDLAIDVLSAAQAGYAGLDTYWRGTLFGVRFAVVPGMTAATAIAADPTALAIGRSDVMQLVDPYSSSTSNGVIIRTEVSVAAAVLDPTAVGVCTTAP
jgi:hypothetical protein